MNTPGTNLGWAKGFIIAPYVVMYTGCDWEENVFAELLSESDMLSFKFPRFTNPLPIDHASFFVWGISSYGLI